jgi:hypothetical protein
MIRLKISSIDFSEKSPGALEEIKIEGLVGKSLNSSIDKDEIIKAIKEGEDFILLTNKKLIEKVSGRSGKKSNPLMLNFEDYSE